MHALLRLILLGTFSGLFPIGCSESGDDGSSWGAGGGSGASGERDPDGDEVVNASPGECELLLEGASGDEPDGRIPVCCVPSAEEKAMIDQVFALLNRHRNNNGLSSLVYDVELEAAIQGHCIHMLTHDFFDHYAPERSVADPWARAERCGTRASAENIAGSFSTAEEVMAEWTASPGHNENMLNPGVTRVGIGYVSGGAWNTYWGQLFGD